MYQIFPSSPTLSNIQRCFFPSNIPSEHYGKWVFLTTSCDNRYFVKVCVQPLLKDNTCVLDQCVQCMPRHCRSNQQSLNYDNIQIVPSIKFIKVVHVVLVFSSIWDVKKWHDKSVSFMPILKLILEAFVLANNISICVNGLNDINKLGIHTIVIKNIGNVHAGKVVETTKLEIDNVTCYDRFILKENKAHLPIGGLLTQHNALKDLLISIQQCSLIPTPLSSSLKILIIGPDGCGKKSLTKSVASECEAVVITIDGPELSRPDPGETEKLLNMKFNEAILHSKEGLAILLLSRIEAVCGSRVSSHIIHLLDSIPQGLAIIGTTSKPQLLNTQTSSRFYNRIFINTPTESERCEMINALSEGELSGEAAVEMARKTPGFVLADLKLLLIKAKRLYKLKSTSSSRKGDFAQAVEECLYQVEGSAVRGELGLVKAEKLDMQKLGGLAEVKRVLTQSVLWPLSHPQILSTFNIHRPSGVLLYGPPGCAKTSLARAIASSSDLTFLSVSAADLLSPYVGDAELTLTGLFQRARDASPTLLFIDEIDSLVGSRGDKHRGAQERLLSTFLVEMDGIGVKGESNGNSALGARVTVIGATNRPDCVDPALLRPGRLDRLVYVPPPTLDERLEILTLLAKEVPLSDCVDLKFIAEHTDLYSGADLKHLCQEAGLQALTREGMAVAVVRQEDWLAALRETPPSLTLEQLNFYTNFSFSKCH